jgi:hypothetical protein
MENTKTAVTHFWHEEESDILIWGLVLVALIAGLLVRNSVVSETRSFSGANVALNFPASWVEQTQPGKLLSVSEGLGSSAAAAALTVQQRPYTKLGPDGAPQTFDDNVLSWTVLAGKDLVAYRVLGTTQTSIKGVPAALVDYAYVQTHSSSGVASLPLVVRAQALLAQRGDQLVVITFAAPTDAWDSAAGQWQAIQNSIAFK